MKDKNYYRSFRGGIIGGQSFDNDESDVWDVLLGSHDDCDNTEQTNIVEAQELPDSGVFVDELGADINYELE